MIRLENVTKRYPGSNDSVVDNLNLHIRKGEICILVGASGCGKTTTMKMINRLIEPTSGKIFIDGKDISTINPIELRLNIGYVIQETGLFPHMSIEKNIATVPLEKRWDKAKIDQRVDELMRLVDLNPAIYRTKRPSALSGGQKQRVGVARALAADPPIMLMDEPFGALDPITRGKLQNEFLNIQAKLKKTIVFVTHDMDEAIKMGDKIGVMQYGHLVQYGTPHEILSSPANEFVESLVGSNRVLKRLSLLNCGMVKSQIPLVKRDDTAKIMSLIENNEIIYDIGIVDDSGLPVGYIRESGRAIKSINSFPLNIVRFNKTISSKASLYEALSLMFSSGEKCLFVINENGQTSGLMTINDVFEAVRLCEW